MCLDGLRAISILLVLASHQIYSNNDGVGFFYDAFDLGNLGVRIFFSISGFLIFQNLYAEARKGGVDFYGFYARRAARLMPVYLVYLAVVFLCAIFLGYRDEISSYFGALTYTRNMIGRGQSLTVHLWSLSVEEQFYFVLPVLIYFFRKNASALAASMIAMALVAIFLRFNATDVAEGTIGRLMSSRSILMYMDCLLLGCLAGMYRYHFNGVGVMFGLFSRAAFIFVPFYLSPLGLYNWRVGVFVDAAVISVFLYCLSVRPFALELRLLESRIFVYTGLISYSLYIWHFIFLEHFNRGLFGGGSDFVGKYWLLLSFLAASLSYKYLEVPMRKFLREKLIGS